jgi:hypothetical protein
MPASPIFVDSGQRFRSSSAPASVGPFPCNGAGLRGVLPAMSKLAPVASAFNGWCVVMEDKETTPTTVHIMAGRDADRLTVCGLRWRRRVTGRRMSVTCCDCLPSLRRLF